MKAAKSEPVSVRKASDSHADCRPYSGPESRSESEALARELTSLAGHINAANYRFLQLLARFDAQGGWCDTGARSCAHWLEWRCGIGLGAAREKVRVARALEHLPKISSAFARGELSYCMVRALSRKACPATEDYYLMIAKHGTVSHVERLVRLHDRAEKLQDGAQEARQHDSREAAFYQDEDGNWIIKAILPPEAGELVVNTLNAIVKQGSDEQHAHEAVRTGVRAGVREGTGTDPAIPVDSMPQKRADALAKMAEHYLATGKDGTRALAGGERCQVMLHVDLETLKRNVRQANGRQANSRLGEDTWLHPDTARRLSCDASLVTVLKDDRGNVLNIGRRSRIVPPHIQRALDTRDQGQCRYPGCQCRQYTDAHHVKHWADGGETSLDNLVTLCRHHHRALHRGEFTVDDNHVFRDRFGKRLPVVFTPDYAAHPGYDDANAATLTVQKTIKGVSCDACTSLWSGEALDYDIAVSALLMMGEMAEQVTKAA